ncbi:MAG: M23 family metallopeptidase, partial [Verrucomicrobiota bacterium]
MKPLWLVFLWLLPVVAWPLDLCLPTGNDALLRGDNASFFQPTAGGSVESGMFGCVRNNEHRLHKGIDIKCFQRNRRGEPLDLIHAVADGEVVFINAKPGLSNYGRYIVLEHRWDGVTVHTLYAHLSAIADGLAAGQPVRKAQVIGTLGHTTNTRERIPTERAHLHFEINLLLNPNFHIWYPKRDPQAPPFGDFNGKNLFGLDAAAVFKEFAVNRKLNFADYVARQRVGFTVLVSARQFPWLRMHPEQVCQPAQANAAPVAYEIAVTPFGLPVTVWARTTVEVTPEQLHRLPVLNRVDEGDMAQSSCHHFLERGRSGWRLSNAGRE